MNNTIINYVNKYNDYSFPKTTRLIKSAYEYFKISMENLSNIGKEQIDPNWENFMAMFASAQEANTSSLNTLIEEYEIIRGKDKTLWPGEERELLDLNQICHIEDLYSDN